MGYLFSKLFPAVKNMDIVNTFLNEYYKEDIDFEYLLNESGVLTILMEGSFFNLKIADMASKVKNKIKTPINSLKTKSEQFQKYIGDIEKKIEKKYNIPMNKVKSDIKHFSNKLKSRVEKAYDKQIPPDKFGKALTKDISNGIQEVFKKYMPKRDSSLLTSNEKEMLIIQYFFGVMFLNTVTLILLSAIAGPAIGGLLTLCVIAPIVEEGAKALVLGEHDWAEFGLMFGIAEFFLYMLKGIPLVAMGVINPINFIIYRVLLVGFHYSTSLMQQKFRDHNMTFTGYFIAVMIHAGVNAFGIVYGKSLLT